MVGRISTTSSTVDNLNTKVVICYRTKSANLKVVSNWFSLYKDVLNENHIDGPLYIWNVDECGCMDSPKPKKVVTVKKLQANQLGPAEKGQTTTAVVFVNAAGMNTKPIIIHKGTHVMEEWRNDIPKGYMLGTSENGWKVVILLLWQDTCEVHSRPGSYGQWPETSSLDGQPQQSYI